MKSQIYIFNEEIIIFEIKQNAQIQNQSGKQANPVKWRERAFFVVRIFRFPGRGGNFGKQKTQEKVQPNAAQNDSQVADIEISVKPQGHSRQKKACGFILSEPVKPVPSDQCDGQKYKNKDIGIKKHIITKFLSENTYFCKYR